MIVDTYSIQNLLDYREIAEMRQDPNYRHIVISKEFSKLTDEVVNRHINADTTEVDAAYRFQFKIIDGMNIVGKLTAIPVMDVVLKQPEIEGLNIVYNQPKKFTLKERIKILLKGTI